LIEFQLDADDYNKNIRGNILVLIAAMTRNLASYLASNLGCNSVWYENWHIQVCYLL